MNPKPDDVLEEALRTYPLADVPGDFSERVMRQVRATPTAGRAIATSPAGFVRFRLTWMDYALGLFGSLLAPLGLGLWAFLPRQAVLQLQFQWQLFQWDVIQPLVAFSLVTAGVLLVLALLFSLGFVLRPRVGAR